jgi:two-component system sensor kinase FixL
VGNKERPGTGTAVLTMNKLLQRQIEKLLESPDSIPAELKPLFEAISDAYDGLDADRRLIERSLDISSEELTQVNQRLRGEVNERGDTEKQLRHSLSLLTATLDSTADGILVVDRSGRVQSFNRKFAVLWRIPDSILASNEDEELLSFVLDQLQDPQGFLAKVQRLYAEPAAESNDLVHFKDGRVFQRYSRPQFLGEEIVGRVWCFRDITETVAANEKLENLVHQLERANKELGDFAYIVSHDLKAPLRGIKTLADWLVADHADQLDQEGKEQLHLLVARVDRMHGLIEGILQYSRIGRIEEEKEQVNLGELVPQIVDLLAVPEHIEITICEELPVVEFERTRITQVFQNLLSNAVKYTDKPQGRITVDCRSDGTQWRFSVSDNGPGIDEKYHEKIFQLFETLLPRDQYESTGIGLTLVKKTIELYGGRIWVESRLGEGSTFFFTLPKGHQASRGEKLRTCVAD